MSATSLHVYRNRVVECFVAESLEDAVALARSWYEDMGLEDEECDFDFEQEPDDKRLTIEDYRGDGERVTMTCAEFAKDNGRGMLCSTEF